jgi:hypothetical protein
MKLTLLTLYIHRHIMLEVEPKNLQGDRRNMWVLWWEGPEVLNALPIFSFLFLFYFFFIFFFFISLLSLLGNTLLLNYVMIMSYTSVTSFKLQIFGTEFYA